MTESQPPSLRPAGGWDWRPTFEALRISSEAAQLPLSQVVVLLPFAQAMAEAKRHWLVFQADGLMPRFETTTNWAQAMRPWSPQGQNICFDPGRDTATALDWLDQLDSVRMDAAWTEHMAGQLVQAAHSLAPLAAAQPPAQRAAWAQTTGEAVVVDGSGLVRWEALVQRLAWLWVGHSGFATDVLWTPEVAAQWPMLAVVPGWSEDALPQALQAHWSAQGGTTRVLPTPLQVAATHGPRWQACSDVHDEAMAAAASVWRALEVGAQRVGLVALDRAVTRRAVALLATRGLDIRDETGWRLSTSRQAAAVMAVLQAAMPQATTDAWVNALLHMPLASDVDVQTLEQKWRDQGRWQPSLSPQDPPWLHRVAEVLQGLREPRSWNRWQRDVVAALQDLGVMEGLRADPVGQRLIEVAAWALPAREDLPKLWRHMSLARYVAWLRSAWEGAPFRPAFAPDAPVVVVPLAQVLMRDLDAVVMPGCDANSLPVAVQPPGPWTQAQRELAGLPDRARLTQDFARAWASVVQHTQLTVLWRTQDGGEAVGPAHWVLRTTTTHGVGDKPTQQQTVTLAVPARPQPRLSEVDAALLPPRVSATRYQRLRACPYQFFVADVLGLSADEELDELASRRDLGLWLHAVLQRFHATEPEAVQADRALSVARLDHWAEQVRLDLGLDEVAFLPFQASWPLLREGYLDWLAAHRRTGARAWRLEHAWTHELAEGVHIFGQLDRVDRSDLATDAPQLWVMDYKTERAEAARRRANSGTEDTQLAFYAALAQQAVPEAEVKAAYLCVGDANRDAREAGTVWAEHVDVMADAEVVMAGVQADWQALQSGAAMPALGESPACDHCRARGLCRRDVWEIQHG